ncbi:hypothetical protein [Kordiimonas gwangyangensis]|uniref:hypothetical protein n=1 Tax=Kordiimonas gwangyangensis TaxID=288022 RepID=UPI00046FE444|nr:hypothetical protein [Kordiimonas gwangyangensis]
MKVKHIAAVALLTFSCPTLSFSAENTSEVNEFNVLKAQLREATDRRDGQIPAFDAALETGNFEALVMLGQIGGDACDKIIPYLASNDGARPYARKGAMHCHDDRLADACLPTRRRLLTKMPLTTCCQRLVFRVGRAHARP